MPVAPSFDDLIAQFEAEALAQNSELAFNDGDVTEAQAHGAGAMADAAIRFNVQAFKETFIDGAKGDALTALVDDHLNIQRQPATASQCTVRFSRTSGGAGFTLAAGFVVASEFDDAGNTILYTLDADVTFAGADNGPHSGSVTAEITGKDGNVAAAKITRFVDAKPDATIVVTNLAAAAGGNNEESDSELRVRARLFWQTLRRGTLAALEFGALQVASVRTVRATEDISTGAVTVVVADSDGASTAQMVSDAEAEIENWRAAGVSVAVLGGTQLLVNVTGVLVVNDGVDAAALVPLVQAAIESRLAKQRQGELLYLDSVKAAGIGVDPDAIDALTLSLPAANVTPTATQTVRAGTITIT
ncbi:MAG TPA: baseplate J/gp47 family protein [Kofleriaceae bacterium]|nr:baseplate J/gp47 family protein [Kofleriaceae bacterium]